MAILTVEQLATAVGCDPDMLTSSQRARMESMIADLEADIIATARQPLEESTDEIVLDAAGGRRLTLPRWPVTAVTEVIVTDADGVDTTLVYRDDYTWSRVGILTRRSSCWPHGDQCVTVTYTAGYATWPAPLVSVARRTLTAAWDMSAGAVDEQLGDHRIKLTTPAGSLTSADIATIEEYAR